MGFLLTSTQPLLPVCQNHHHNHHYCFETFCSSTRDSRRNIWRLLFTLCSNICRPAPAATIIMQLQAVLQRRKTMGNYSRFKGKAHFWSRRLKLWLGLLYHGWLGFVEILILGGSFLGKCSKTPVTEKIPLRERCKKKC